MPSIRLQSVSYASMVVAACTNLGGSVRFACKARGLSGRVEWHGVLGSSYV